MGSTEAGAGPWRLARVSAAPDFFIEAWSAYDAPFDGEGLPPTRHFTGFCMKNQQARASSPIEVFDPVARVGVSRSGRVYQLMAVPGVHGEAFSMWAQLKRINQIASDEDVTEAVALLMAQSAPGPGPG